MKRTVSGLKRLLTDLDLPEADRPRVESDLLDGLANFRAHDEVAGYYTDAELLRYPYIFGFGAVAVARDPVLDLNTRLAVVRSAIRGLRPLDDNGIPHGLPALLSFLAGAGALHRVTFQVVMIATDMAGDLYYDWRTHEARVLLDWLIAKSEIPDADALWRLYYLFSHCDKAPVGKAMFRFVLDHPAWPNGIKRDLCLAVLAERDTLRPPALWRAFWASLRGDEQALKQAQAELEPAVLDDLIRSADESEDDFAGTPRAPSFGFISSLLRGGESFGLIPPYFKRMAGAARLLHRRDQPRRGRRRACPSSRPARRSHPRSDRNGAGHWQRRHAPRVLRARRGIVRRGLPGARPARQCRLDPAVGAPDGDAKCRRLGTCKTRPAPGEI